MGDLTNEQLIYIALQNGNNKATRLLRVEAEACIRTESLKARYSFEELEAIETGELNHGLYEIGDLTQPVLGEIMNYLRPIFAPYGFKPFDLSLSCSHVGNPGEEAVESTPANIIKLHHGRFYDMDLFTLGTLNNIRKTAGDPAAAPTIDALQLEIPGHLKPNYIDALNRKLARYDGYGYSSRIVRPTLSMALQSAIQRQSSPTALRPTVTVTSTRGPSGGLLTVVSEPVSPIRLFEGSEDYTPGVGRLLGPSNYYLVRELLRQPGTEHV